MSFGPDIKELLEELGVAYTILRDGGDVAGEYLVYKINRQVTKPFIREYFREATISYDSSIVHGDVIQFDDDSTKFLISSLSPRRFEGEKFDNQVTLYKCNVSGELLRYSGEQDFDDLTYREAGEFTPIKDPCYGLLVEEMYGNYLDQDSPPGQVENRALVLYIPSSVGIRPLDRYTIIGGEEAYKVEEVDTYTFQGVHVAHLEKDTR